MRARPASIGPVRPAALVALSLCGAWVSSCGSSPEQQTPKEWLEENTFLLQNLGSYDANEQLEAVNKFRSVGKQRGTQYALALLMDPTLENYRVEVVLARLLADWRDPAAIDFLLPHVFHPDRSASRIAAEGLAVFEGDGKLVDWLIDRASGPVVRERRIAAELLSRVGGDRAVEFFGERYAAEEDKEVRGLFLMGIADSAHPRRSEFVVEALADDDDGLREYAWNVLQEVKGLPSRLRFDPHADVGERARKLAELRSWSRRERSEVPR